MPTAQEWTAWKERERLRLAPNKADAECSDAIILRLRRRVAELTAQIEWLVSIHQKKTHK
jgi:hypothetical protein